MAIMDLDWRMTIGYVMNDMGAATALRLEACGG
ncbi:hypothetical protein QFZ24_009641 [Streptomyces phaeochromogenes]|nr:hypothetical protein [Streptomyces phaeochromogenes]